MGRSGASAAAAATSLNRFTVVESATITSCGLAPISGAIFAPTRCGAPIQSRAFQPRIRSPPHSSLINGGDPLGDALGQRPQRIAVEIDDAFRQLEALAQVEQRIGGVERLGVGEGDGHRPSARSISSTAAAQAALSGATSSTWPVASIIRTRTSSPSGAHPPRHNPRRNGSG